jgi:hypothetical protein
MTEGSSVDGHVIRGTCAEGTQLWQFQHGDPLQKNALLLVILRCFALTTCKGSVSVLSDGVVHLHEHARPHTTQWPRNVLPNFGGKTMGHPTYRPDCKLSDFGLFPTMQVSRHLFTCDEDTKPTTITWQTQQWGLRVGQTCHMQTNSSPVKRTVITAYR